MPLKSEIVVALHQLGFAYEDLPILQEGNARIFKGECIGIMGPNGGGKTTLLKLLMGFLTPTQGTIQIFGQSPEKARLRIGYVPQTHRTDRDFPITLWELVLLGTLSQSSPWGLTPSSVKKKALFWIDRLGLTPHKEQVFGSLSGGLAQRALLARALVSDPDLLLLDEATANIDTPSANTIFQILQELKGKKTILLVTHDLRTVVERVDRVLCVQRHISSFQPKEICEHFALGLYHTPLLEIPKNHFPHKGSDVSFP